jgi:iron complex outermembrane receptor protein
MRHEKTIPILMVGMAVALNPGLAPGGDPVSSLRAQEAPVRLDTLRVQVGSRVSAGLPVLTRSIQVLDRGEIEAQAARTLAGLLEWATGVDVMARSPAQSDLGIRGGGFEQVVVLVNGVRMSDPQTGHFDLDLAVPLDQVERVEILRGPASALYGADAVGGVVNVVTRQGDAPWQARAEGGSWGSARLSGSASVADVGGISGDVGGELARSDGHRAGTDFETSLLHLSLRRPMGPGALTGEAGFARRDFGARDFYAPYRSYEKTRTYTGSIRWASGGRGGAGTEIGGAYRRHEDEFILFRDDPDYYRNRHTSSQVGGELLQRLVLRSRVDLVVGGEAFGDLLRSNSLGDRTETRGAIFGELVLGSGRAGVASLGLREDWHDGFGGFFSPSVSGSYRWDGGLRLRTAAGRSFRAPTFTERYYQDPLNQGREDLAPERAWSGEVGADFDGTGPFQISLTLFSRWAEDLIDWARTTDAGEEEPWETRNVEDATFQGVEADLSTPGPFDTEWTFGGMLLSVDSEEGEGFRSKYALRPLTEQLTGKVRRSFADRFTLAVHGQRSRRKGEEAYVRLDFRAALRIGPSWLYLDGNNLTDASYPDVTGAPAPGRAFFLGLEVGPGR